MLSRQAKRKESAMDFYGNDDVLRAESKYRVAELQRDARRSVAPSEGAASRSEGWSREFAEWVVSRARVGATFMARHPSSP